ncbi:hypothetical protein SAMN05444955_103313 [Lihuaxuella thermophila]|uniref:Uncharacterized protein n=1 Tax=Lihuaxuella thermophila TaxID=1173111 RepID=A0A1H8CHV3_9BACL|nr:hypothetical protein SAMN05444955_103313 [Lihuaxuella thermophila]
MLKSLTVLVALILSYTGTIEAQSLSQGSNLIAYERFIL